MTRNKIITLIFTIIIFYFPICAINSYIQTLTKPNTLKSQKINWEKFYPFTQNKEENTTNRFNTIEKINSKFRSKTTNIEEKFSNFLPFRCKLSEIQMQISKLFGVKLFLEYDGLVVMNNDYLEYWKKYKSPQKAFEDILGFVEFLNSNKTDFVYVQFPCKNYKYDNQLPIGLKDNNNITCDEFINLLNQNVIKTLDLRNKIDEYSKSQYDMFFKTDHHWKPSA